MKTPFDYPAEKSQLAAFRSANPGCKLVYAGTQIIVLTGGDIDPPITDEQRRISDALKAKLI